MTREELRAKIAALPADPGCYQMKDANNTIIYVGKAKNLKNRVSSYFTGAHDHKTTKMVSHIADFDYVITKTEKEALVLEINLIKKHTPRYNIMFMDDKTYPYIKLTDEEYPVLKVVRDRKKDKKATYIGPYPDVLSARETIRLLNVIYPLRKCNRMEDKLCLYYHLHQCLGMCEKEVDKEEYRKMCDKALRFLRGDTAEIMRELIEKRNAYSENLEFEKAGEIQEQIEAIKATVDRQNIETQNKDNQDVWNIYCANGYISISCLEVRKGAVSKKNSFVEVLYEEENDAVVSFMSQYYEKKELPKEILLPASWDISAFDDELFNRLFQPKKGHKQKLLDMAYSNAREYLERQFKTANNMTNDFASQMALQQLVGREVHRIELYDNSHIGGEDAVCGMVVYKDGKAIKNQYRKFRVHNKGNDIANMQEAIYRRYFRALSENLEMADLIIVDGGDLQIKAAKEILVSLGLDIPVYGLVKNDRHDTSDLMNEDLERLSIEPNSALFFFLARMQDEVHRFAITYFRKKHVKSMLSSKLEEIPGVGEKRRKKLLKTFGSFSAIKEKSVEELAEAVPKDVAERIYAAFHVVE